MIETTNSIGIRVASSPTENLQAVRRDQASGSPAPAPNPTINANEFNVVQSTNTVESNPALSQNNLSASNSRGSTLDILA